MSIRKTTKTVYECICELPDCPGKGEPWISQDERIPKRCRWCGHYSWNGQDRRRKADGYVFVRARQCTTCGGTEWIKDGAGRDVCATCAQVKPNRHPASPTTAKKTAAKTAAIKLPRPRKVRSVE